MNTKNRASLDHWTEQLFETKFYHSIFLFHTFLKCLLQCLFRPLHQCCLLLLTRFFGFCCTLFIFIHALFWKGKSLFPSKLFLFLNFYAAERERENEKGGWKTSRVQWSIQIPFKIIDKCQTILLVLFGGVEHFMSIQNQQRILWKWITLRVLSFVCWFNRLATCTCFGFQMNSYFIRTIHFMGPLLFLYVLSFLILGYLDAVGCIFFALAAGKLFNFPMIVCCLIKSMENPNTIPLWALNSQTGDWTNRLFWMRHCALGPLFTLAVDCIVVRFVNKSNLNSYISSNQRTQPNSDPAAERSKWTVNK